MHEADSELYIVTMADMKNVIETLVQAFLDDPLLGYFFDEPEGKLRFLKKYFNYRVRNGLLDGSIFASSENIEGIVILTQSEYKKFSWVRALRTGGMGLYRAAGSKILKRMQAVESFVVSKRSECISEPYWYLGSLAIHPNHQGKGLAGKLVRHVLDVCSFHRKLCVLETQHDNLVGMYKHFGFEVIDSFTLPDANIPHRIMAKPP
jgi:ribosomal protein S18 acetylase RimI-like enzyme